MKKLFTAVVLVLAFALAAGAETIVKVGTVGENVEMWAPITEELKKEGIIIELVKFADYSLPNQALADGETDLNAFQHYAFFENEKKNRGLELVAIGETFISPMCVYSKKVKDVKDLKKGAKIAIPNDATNEGRGLKVLEAAGLIKVSPEVGFSPELGDITDNPLEIEFVEVDAAQLLALLADVDAAVINCNYVLDQGMIPERDSIFFDKPQGRGGNPFVNIIAARAADKDNPVYKRVVEAYQTQAVIDVFNEVYKGAYVPAWN